MNYFTIKPSPQLARYVKYFWVLEGEATSSRPYIHRSMASGCAEILFHYKGVFDECVANNSMVPSFQSGLAGQTSQVRRFIIKQNFGIFGVYLYPFSASHMFLTSATEFKDQMIDLQSLLGKEADALEERMMLADTTSGRVKIISEFIESRVPATNRVLPGIVETIKHMIDTKGTVGVEALAQRNFLSTQQFERSFLQFTGFNPKLFSRIVRFQSALEKYGSSTKSLTTIAYESGYYDQSHFIHEFKQFSGHNPKEYFAGKTETTVWKD